MKNLNWLSGTYLAPVLFDDTVHTGVVMGGTATGTNLLCLFPPQSLSLKDSPTHSPPHCLCPPCPLSSLQAIHSFLDQLEHLPFTCQWVGIETWLLGHHWPKLIQAASLTSRWLGNWETDNPPCYSYSRSNCCLCLSLLCQLYHLSWSLFS